MALLHGLLWRILLALVHVNRVLVSWLRVRLRTWKCLLRERVMAAILLPFSSGGSRDCQRKTQRNSSASAAGDRGRWAPWPSEGKAFSKLPVHIGLLVAEEEPSYTDVANLVVWCMTVGISYVSVYDNNGKTNDRGVFCFV